MKKIEKILESITAVILLVMLICCLLQVLFRFVLHISAPFTEEFARMGYIWMVFLTLPLLEAKNEQLKVTFFFDKIPMAIRAVLYWVISVAYVVLLVFTLLRVCKHIDLCFCELVADELSIYSCDDWLRAGYFVYYSEGHSFQRSVCPGGSGI